MNETRWNMSALRNLDLSEVSIVEKPETHYLVTVPISQGIPFEQEIEKVVVEAKKYQLKRLHDASYGSILPVEDLYCGHYHNYSALYMELPFPYPPKGASYSAKRNLSKGFLQGKLG